MSVATVTSKGQVTIPAEIRSAFSIEEGDQLVFYPSLDGDLKLHVRKTLAGSGRGYLSARGRHVPVEMMNPAGGPDDDETAS
jgi:AbrB family looped-hinge helix DNA binding protein